MYKYIHNDEGQHLLRKHFYIKFDKQILLLETSLIL